MIMMCFGCLVATASVMMKLIGFKYMMMMMMLQLLPSLNSQRAILRVNVSFKMCSIC